ncbi:EscU/YscU/HrcU family type III secretion system export apparatus switch protein [Anaerotignum faecicola]|nr:EscU/YscU/HrcU family type III secretion system export apparatus switch protein [Anaerotignum faecicola]
MSKYNLNTSSRAVALKYDGSDVAPIVVASGMGHMAEKIVETAVENNVPVFEDNSLATILSRLELGQEIPEELFKMVVDIYVYFLNFSLKNKGEQPGMETEPAKLPVQDGGQ